MNVPSLSQRSPDMTLVLISLSGGGYRASLFHSGVLRVFHEKGILRRSTDTMVLLSAVSGGSIPALLWDAYLRTDSTWQKSQPLWPERQLLRLIAKSPSIGACLRKFAPYIGGMLTWRTRGFFVTNPWHSLLVKWWNEVESSFSRHLDPLLKYDDSSLCVLIEAIDFIYGDVWVFNRDSVTVPDRELFKTGANWNTVAGVSVPLAITAATAVPFYFPPAKVKGRSAVFQKCREMTLVDAGIVDNLGLYPLLPLFKKDTSGRSMISTGDEWYLSDAGRQMVVLDDPLWISLKPKTKRLRLKNKIGRVVGQLPQESFVNRMMGFIDVYTPVKASGIKIGSCLEDKKPWWIHPRLPRIDDIARIPTTVNFMPHDEALAILLHGAQSASEWLGLDQNSRERIKGTLFSLQKSSS